LKKVLFLFTFFTTNLLFSQRVGLVLSGGGASGFAHIGVLKALEENNIPIAYITGTSAGALVGSMYACGYSPKEIEAYVLSEKFQYMTQGKLEKNQEFFFFENDEDASVFSIPFAKDSILKKSLPTNFISSVLLDFEMMRVLGATSASYGDDFNNLFVPFNCVASDIVKKESVVFSKGKLNLVVRASMTYPFFISPIEIDGKMLFDGGLYNNFPLDVMYLNHDVDFIIGSNVTSNAAKPTEDDLFSQIENMLVSYSNFTLPCESGIIINPKLDLNTFQFDQVKKAIDQGYLETLKHIDSLRKHIVEIQNPDELREKRIAFKKVVMPLTIGQISTIDKNGKVVNFVSNSISKKSKPKIISEKKFTKRYFRTSNFDQVDNLYPALTKTDTAFNLNLYVKRAKEFKLDVGGHFSSRPINTGYIGLSYLYVKKHALKLKAESYFGRFYGSIKTSLDYTVPSYYPISAEPYFVMNRWDYFRSSATFFEDVKPSFLVQNDIYYGLKFKNPIGNKGKSTIDARIFELDDTYYQTKEFTSKDTADLTVFKGNQLSWNIEFNTLNKKQFANEGSLFNMKLRYVNGKERSISGSTSPVKYDETKAHKWIQLNLELQNFMVSKKHFHLGVHGKMVLNSQSLFKNYTATLLNTTEFAPIPDLQTFFLAEYRSPQHIGLGINTIFTPFKNLDIRFDSYYYQPFKQLVIFDDGTFGYSKIFKGETWLYSLSSIYHSPIGPIRATFNYFPKQEQKIWFQLSYGFLIFNERAIR
jgi:NTE family protein